MVSTTGALVKGAYGHSSVYDEVSGLIYVFGGSSRETKDVKLSDSLVAYNARKKHWFVHYVVNHLEIHLCDIWHRSVTMLLWSNWLLNLLSLLLLPLLGNVGFVIYLRLDLHKHEAPS